MFRKLAGLLGFQTDKTVAPMFALNRDQVAQLASLRDSAEWQTYLQLLDNASILFGEALLGARDDVSLHELRGTILGLRKAARLVDETLDKAKELAKAEQRRVDNERDRRDASNSILYGSPAWGRTGE